MTRPVMFPALTEPTVRRYLLGQVVSVLGAWTQAVTLNLLLWQLTASPSMLGILNFLLYGPVLVIGPFVGGRIGPRNARKAVLTVLIGSILIGLVMFTLSLLNRVDETLLLIASGALGVLTAMEMPSRQVLLTTSLSDRTMITGAVALNTMAYNVGRMIGPAIAAVLFEHAGAAGGFLASAAALAFMVWCLSGIHPRADVSGKSAGGLKAAFNFARANPFARLYLPILTAIAVFAGCYQTLVPVLADRGFGQVSAYTGLFFSFAGAGSLCSALLLSTPAAGSLVERFLRWTPTLCALSLGGIALATNPIIAFGCFWLLGLTLTFTTTSINTGLQIRSPDELRGGIVGLYGTAFVGMVPVGYLIAGQLSQAIGVRWTFGVMSTLLMATIVVLHAVQHRRMTDSDTDSDETISQ